MNGSSSAFCTPPPINQTSFLSSNSTLVNTSPSRFSSKRARVYKRAPISLSAAADDQPQKNDDDDDDSIPVIGDWREFRAALVAGSADELQKRKDTAYRTGHWAHSLSLPETGCFLASHPAYYKRSAPYLTQAVVFITSYDESKGATGLVLNRPLRGDATELEAAGMFGRSTNFASTPLASLPVYCGGPDTVSTGVLTAVHADQSLFDTSKQTTTQPLEGVFVGDVSDCLQNIKSDTDCSSIRLFAGCIRWSKGELEKEVNDGSWFCVSASNLFALEHCIQLPKPLWVEIMQSQGHPFAKIASQVYDEDNESK